ncbi:MAG: DUF58 domain-containing protein [Alphaproteobacteria bacterium]|nr:DUF58 domain-containing protein [Alphaproteobacteria bacterium]
MRSFGLKLAGLGNRETEQPASIRQRAEETAARLPPLLVAAERIAATVAQGVHGRRRVGQGESFWQFRRYQQGDPVQRIDWRQSAKREHLYVRENEWEAAQSVWVWLDRSASMQYHSKDGLPDKADRATVLMLALSSLLIRGGERVTLLGSGVPPSNGRAVMDRLVASISLEDSVEESAPPLEQLPRYGRVVMISDFLTPPDEIEQTLRVFASLGVRGHLLQIFDPAEQSLPFAGRVRFEGLEGEGEALIGRVEAVKAEYVLLMEKHRRAIEDIARRLGWTCIAHATDQPPQTALLALYHALAETPES